MLVTAILETIKIREILHGEHKEEDGQNIMENNVVFAIR